MNQGREILVGAVIILAVVVVGAGTLFLKGARIGQTFVEVDVLVRDIGQLTEGNTVKFRGVNIGEVTDVEVIPSGEAVRVSLELVGEHQLAEDAVAIIAPESLFGDWQAEIVSRERFPRFEYYEVEEGRVEDGVPVIGGYALPDISRLTAAADEISQNLAVLSDRVDRAFSEETAENLRLTIENVQQVSEDIKNLIDQQAATFANVSADVERAATEIGGAATQGRVTLERLDQVLAGGKIDSILVSVERASRDMEAITGEVNTAAGQIDQTLLQVDSTFASVLAITNRIERGEGSLGLFLTDTSLYVRAQDVVTRLDSLLADIQQNPGRYINFSIF